MVVQVVVVDVIPDVAEAVKADVTLAVIQDVKIPLKVAVEDVVVVTHHLLEELQGQALAHVVADLEVALEVVQEVALDLVVVAVEVVEDAQDVPAVEALVKDVKVVVKIIVIQDVQILHK